MSWRGFSNRLKLPTSATTVAATRIDTPRKACTAATTGASVQGGTSSTMACFQPVAQLLGPLDPGQELLQHEMLRRLSERQLAKPATVRLGPVRAGKAPAVPQQEAMQLLASLALVLHRQRAHAHQIPHRLVRLVWNPHLRQLTGPQHLGEHHRIATIGLDLVAGLPRDQRWRHHVTAVPQAR